MACASLGIIWRPLKIDIPSVTHSHIGLYVIGLYLIGLYAIGLYAIGLYMIGLYAIVKSDLEGMILI